MTYHFDPNTHFLVTSIEARRPHGDGGGLFFSHWEGLFYDYELHGGVIGWVQVGR